MVIVSRVFIFYDFSKYPLLRRIRLLHRSSQRLKAAANSSTPILLVTPSRFALLYPLFGLFFGLGRVEGHYCFVHLDDIVQH
jgi:hypothetical protein